MSPASYLAAPPRDAADIVAPLPAREPGLVAFGHGLLDRARRSPRRRRRRDRLRRRHAAGSSARREARQRDVRHGDGPDQRRHARDRAAMAEADAAVRRLTAGDRAARPSPAPGSRSSSPPCARRARRCAASSGSCPASEAGSGGREDREAERLGRARHLRVVGHERLELRRRARARPQRGSRRGCAAARRAQPARSSSSSSSCDQVEAVEEAPGLADRFRALAALTARTTSVRASAQETTSACLRPSQRSSAVDSGSVDDELHDRRGVEIALAQRSSARIAARISDGSGTPGSARVAGRDRQRPRRDGSDRSLASCSILDPVGSGLSSAIGLPRSVISIGSPRSSTSRR